MKKRLSCLMIFALVMVFCLPMVAGAEMSDSQIKYAGGTLYYDADGNKVTAAALGENDSVVSVSRTIKGTNTANEFIITLDVETTVDISEIELSPDAAVVLVLDVSTSMSNDLSNLKKAAIDFLDEFASNNADRYVSLVTYSTDAKVECGWTNISDPVALEAMKKQIGDLRVINTTYIQGGLQLARNLLPSTPQNIANRSVILFTDGQANCLNNSIVNETAVDVVLRGASGTAANCESAAAAMANLIKDANNPYNAKLYTVAYGTAKRDWLAGIATNSSYAKTADKASELSNAFIAISQSIEKWAQAWVVTDPMGENIKFKQAISQNDIDTGLLNFQNGTLQWNLKDALPTLVNEVTFSYSYSYRIQIDTDADLDPDVALPTNGETTLNYVMVVNDEVRGDVLTANFLIPEVIPVLTPGMPASGY